MTTDDPREQQIEEQEPSSAYLRSPYYGDAYYGAYGGSYDRDEPEIRALVDVAVRFLRRHWKTVLLATILGGIAAMFYLLTATKIFEARSLIEMTVRRPRIMNRQDAVLEDRATTWRSGEVIQTRLRKYMRADTRQKVMGMLTQQGETNAASYVPSGQFSLLPETKLVQITCRHRDPRWAYVSANAYAEAAEQIALDENKAQSDKADAWLRSQADALRHALVEAEQSIVEFRSNTQLDLIESRKTTAELSVAELNTQLVQIKAKHVLANDLWDKLRGLESDFAGVEKMPPTAPFAEEVQQRFQELASASGKRDELLVKYRPQHPSVIAQEQIIAGLRSSILSTIRRSAAAAKSDVDLLSAQMSSLVDTIQEQRKELAELELTQVNQRTQLESLEREKQAADISYRGVLQRIEEARLSADEDTTTVKLVDRATLPRVPVHPRPRKALALGIALGLALGVGISFLKELLNDRISSAREIEERLGARIIGLVPLVKGDPRREKIALASLNDGNHELAEIFAGLRAFLASDQTREKSRVLLITSTAPEEGKTITASNLAIMYARAGTRTLLIDMDLRRPRIGRLYGCDNEGKSLAKVLATGESNPGAFLDLVQETACPGLSVISTRPRKELRAADLVASETVQALIRWAGERFDQVVIDTPPHGLISDAAVLAGLVGGVVLVCRADSSRRGDLKHAARHFEDMGGNLLGVVVNGVPARQSGYFGRYHYPEGYDSGEEED